ncbi:MAG: fucose isomerase [Phycisphaerae bacterium]|nr:fucose isomerase [Phycisphaerae bacterium]
MAKKGKTTFGLVVGCRGFFPDRLAKEGREAMIKHLKAQGHDVVVLGPSQSKHGCVETFEEAKACAELFAQNAGKIDGIIVTLPNFGDEKGVAEAIKRSGLDVPVLVHAWPDDLDKLSIQYRRDSFCGKLSVCDNLRQYDIPYTLTSLHTEAIDSEAFAMDLASFAATCRVTTGLRGLRVGAIGARPAAFNTCRYSERLLQGSNISVETLDLSEVIGRAEKLKASDAKVRAKINAIRKYVKSDGVPQAGLERLARLAVVLEGWVTDNEISALALQCWTSLEEYYGVVPCAAMSMLSEKLVPAACEVDVCGAVAMYALQCASGTPSALLDLNNNFGDDPDKMIMFHCSNLPASFLDNPEMSFNSILGGTVGQDNAYGTVTGAITPGPATMLRVSTDDYEGEIVGYVAEGQFTDDRIETFGGRGVLQIDDLQFLLRYICETGMEHHVAVNKAHVGDGIAEALNTYMGWDIYQHE